MIRENGIESNWAVPQKFELSRLRWCYRTDLEVKSHLTYIVSSGFSNLCCKYGVALNMSYDTIYR